MTTSVIFPLVGCEGGVVCIDLGFALCRGKGWERGDKRRSFFFFFSSRLSRFAALHRRIGLLGCFFKPYFLYLVFPFSPHGTLDYRSRCRLLLPAFGLYLFAVPYLYYSCGSDLFLCGTLLRPACLSEMHIDFTSPRLEDGVMLS